MFSPHLLSSRCRRPALGPPLLFMLLILPSCAAPEPEPASIRLTDLFPTATVADGVATPADLPRTEWRFDAGTGGTEVFVFEKILTHLKANAAWSDVASRSSANCSADRDNSTTTT